MMRYAVLFSLFSVLASGCFFDAQPLEDIACESNDDCAAGERCVSNACLAAELSGGCLQPSDCDTGACNVLTGECIPGNCNDELQNGDESDVDCGGTCARCAEGALCGSGDDCESGVCKLTTGDDPQLRCQLPACNDGVLNGAESDVDCGAGIGCPTCEAGQTCLTDEQCTSGVCDEENQLCLEATCSDGVLNASELGVDCGGGCVGCSIGASCVVGSDCLSGVCGEDGLCARPACDDAVLNGFEPTLDCGGPDCPPCAEDGAACNIDADCESQICEVDACASPTCSDEVSNGLETDVDCGGGWCNPCDAGQGCEDGEDCSTSICAPEGVCVAAGCDDAVENGDETDLDCGGSCTPCEDGLSCNEDLDCASGVCIDGTCASASCEDGAQNGSETGEDCGGACPPCEAGEGCETGADCASGVCTGRNRCAEPSCSDGVRNGEEADLDCGASCGSAADLCRPGQRCDGDSDCAGTAFCVLADGEPEKNRCVDHPPHCTAIRQQPTGVYTIDPDGFAGAVAPFEVYCDNDTRGGGWTLVIRARGDRGAFQYDQGRWTNRSTLNPELAALDWTQVKLESFHTVPVSEILIGMAPLSDRSSPPSYSDDVASILVSSDSLYSLMNGNYRRSYLGRGTWRDLISGDSLQDNCDLEGINVRPTSTDRFSRVRFGIIANEQDDCGSPDSVIGVGIGGSSDVTVGNRARYGGDNGNKDIGTLGLVFVRSELRTCYDHLNAGDTTSGVKSLDLDGSGSAYTPTNAYCDMDTDGGGWTLAANYLHQGGTNPSTTVLSDRFPIPTRSELGADGSGSESWGHVSNRMLRDINIAESRFYGVTSEHNRTLHFKDVGFDLNRYLMEGDGCTEYVLWVELAGHDAMLPDSLDYGSCNEGDNAMLHRPFYQDGVAYWTVGEDGAWEVDNRPGSGAHDTHHQVWVR